MRLLIQRVKEASVIVNEITVGKVGRGLLIFVGIGEDSSLLDIPKMVKKSLELRIFENSEGKMSDSILDIKGEILVVSQFTLYASLDKGRRPDFTKAAKPEIAKEYFSRFIEEMKNSQLKVESGVFGANMKVQIVNDGPVTIWLDSKMLK